MGDFVVDGESLFEIGVGNKMKFNWNQSGMPTSLVSRTGVRNEFAEFKTVLNDAGNHVLRGVDADSMARELVDSGGRNIVEMVRDLTTALQNAERELTDANRRYERLVADLARRGITVTDEPPEQPKVKVERREPKSILDADVEWEEWDRKFRALLD